MTPCLNLVRIYLLDAGGQDPSLASKSRFLGQQGFKWYKFIVAFYFVFWCLWWPLVEGIDDAYKFATYWTFYTAAMCECLGFA